MFAALADRTRRGIVARLSEGEATVGELAAPYAMSLQAVSQHIGVLERCGLISRWRQRLPGSRRAGALGPSGWTGSRPISPVSRTGSSGERRRAGAPAGVR